jgi:superfamily II DNA or RNA helicase
MINNVKQKIQTEALSRWKLAGKRGLLAMGTGSGKSKVALDRCWELFLQHGENLRVLIAVPTTKLRDENWPDEVKKWNMYPLIEEKGMTDIVCYASLSKQPEGHYHLVILDEAHRSTEYNTQIFGKITYDELMGLSATPPKDPEKKKLLDALCPTVFTYSIDDGVEDGVVADYDVIVIDVPPDNSDKYLNGGNKAKPFKQTEASRYTYLTKIIEPRQIQLREKKKALTAAEFIAAGTGDYTDANILKKEVNTLEIVLRKKILERAQLIYNLKGKEIVAKRVLAAIHTEGKRTLVFAGSIAQAEAMTPNTYHSKTNSDKLQQFISKKIDLLSAVNALNEGMNIPDLDQALIIQVSSNERDLVQRIGRVIRYRPGFKGRIFILVATGTVDETWAEKALASIDPSRIKYISHKNF